MVASCSAARSTCRAAAGSSSASIRRAPISHSSRRRADDQPGRPTMSQKIVPYLWYDQEGEEAANFYVGLLPDSRIDRVVRAPIDTPSGPRDHVMVVEFTLAGQRYVALNGGSMYKHSEAISFMIKTDDQAETDRLWDAIVGNGGEEGACGWCKDKWG